MKLQEESKTNNCAKLPQKVHRMYLSDQNSYIAYQYMSTKRKILK